METSIVIPDNSKILTKRPACHTQLIIVVKDPRLIQEMDSAIDGILPSGEKLKTKENNNTYFPFLLGYYG